MTRLAPRPNSTSPEAADPDATSAIAGASRWPLRSLAIGFGLGILVAGIAPRVLRSPQVTEAPAGGPAVAADGLPSVSITATTAEEAIVARRLEATGSVSARELLPIASQATGLQIREVLVDEGDLVRRGQVLARLDDTRLQAELARTKATVAEAVARLDELLAGARAEEIARAEAAVTSSTAAVRQAESRLALARGRVESNRSLAAEGAITADRLNELVDVLKSEESELEQAQADLREERQTLQELRAGTRPETIRQAEAQLASARADERVMAAQLQDTRILAPADGRILERQARVGDVISSSDTLFSLVEGDRLELRLQLPETQLGKIEPGQAVTATAGGFPEPFEGTIREIQPAVDEESRQATVKVELPNSDRLRPGMFLRAQIVVSNFSSVVLPSKAVLPQSDGSGLVYRLQANDTVTPQRVELGELLVGDRIEILAGLAPGDRVAVEGTAYLKPGDRIEVTTR
ncbi:MAG: efflux RND transporter periplasmic adaptor subunit [Cyanobacteria bacterium J06641_5]